MLWSTKWPFLKWKLVLRSWILGYKFSKYMPAVSSSVCCLSRPASFIYYQVPTLHFISPDRVSSGNFVMILTFEILFQFSKSPFIWTIKFILNNFRNRKIWKMDCSQYFWWSLLLEQRTCLDHQTIGHLQSSAPQLYCCYNKDLALI